MSRPQAAAIAFAAAAGVLLLAPWLFSWSVVFASWAAGAVALALLRPRDAPRGALLAVRLLLPALVVAGLAAGGLVVGVAGRTVASFEARVGEAFLVTGMLAAPLVGLLLLAWPGGPSRRTRWAARVSLATGLLGVLATGGFDASATGGVISLGQSGAGYVLALSIVSGLGALGLDAARRVRPAPA